MIRYTRGNILADDAEALINAVNCVGVMGRGVALAFKRAFPANFREYEDACRRGCVRPGSMFVHDTRQLTNPRYIINFPTKRHWRNPSSIADIDTGLVSLVALIQERGIRSIALPALGCGNGGLNWDDVRPRIERALEPLHDVRVTVYEPERR